MPIAHHMPGGDLQPSALPKIAQNCSFIFNCKLGNKAFEGPNPAMKLPNLFTLREKFLQWAVQPGSGAEDRHLITELGLPCRGFTPPFRGQG